MGDTESTKNSSWFVPMVVGLVIGILVLFLAAKIHVIKILGLDGGRENALPIKVEAYIIPQPDGTCKQYVTGGILYSRPGLSESNADVVQWHGPAETDRVTATFATSGPVNGPFRNPSYSTGTYTSAPMGAMNDYNFYSVTITSGGGVVTTCSNPQYIGVHIQQ